MQEEGDVAAATLIRTNTGHTPDFPMLGTATLLIQFHFLEGRFCNCLLNTSLKASG